MVAEAIIANPDDWWVAVTATIRVLCDAEMESDLQG